MDKFGLPGLFLIGIYVFVERNASPELKTRIIENFLLGNNNTVLVLGFFIVLGLLSFGQHHYYKKQLKLKDEEIDRLAKWKSDHQEKAIAQPLHHVQTKKHH